MSTEKKIILFDGVCNLCNSSVLFVIKRDNKDQFRFAALQSEIGQALAKKHQIDMTQVDSIMMIKNDKVFVKSSAALHITRYLSGAYPLLFLFMIIPTFMRNWVYDYVAKNRYKWFGKKDQCMIPTVELKSKFL
tara:strand:- start:2378 stop:2779 length:402 start_codon:yes stop_codon:yes gene_type:complete